MHVDEDLAEAAVGIFAGAKVDLVASDVGLLRVAPAPVRQPFPVVGLRANGGGQRRSGDQ